MYRLRPGVRLREGPDDSYWVFCLDSGEHYELNSTAFRILKVLSQGGDPQRVADSLVEEYGVEGAVAEADISELIDSATTQGLIEREG
jgi:hypothetical protein